VIIRTSQHNRVPRRHIHEQANGNNHSNNCNQSKAYVFCKIVSNPAKPQIYRIISSRLVSTFYRTIPTSEMNLEHTIRSTRRREQDVLCEFGTQFPKSGFRCRLFFRWLSSCNLCFSLSLGCGQSHSFSLLKSKSFESFLLCCLSSCFFCRGDTAHQHEAIPIV